MTRTWTSYMTAAVLAGALSTTLCAQWRQQDRIAGGIASGSLTPGEAASLERQERDVNRQARQDRQANGGVLTPAEQAQIHSERGQLSQEIHADKTNGVRDHYGANEVDARRERQQDRIARGIADGHLNAGEAARLENREASLNREIRQDRQQNGGRLSGQEWRQVNRQQDHLSRAIRRGR